MGGQAELCPSLFSHTRGCVALISDTSAPGLRALIVPQGDVGNLPSESL